MPASKAIRAEVVVTYPDDGDGWNVLQLDRIQAAWLRDALIFAIGESDNGKSRTKDQPHEYAS